MQSTEMSVIGSILMEPAFLGIARGMLSPRMFEDERLARVFSCALKLAKANLPIDTVTVTDKLGDEYGPLIVECAQMVPTVSEGNFAVYAGAVLDAWREREIRAAALEIATGGQTADEMTAKMAELLKRQYDITSKVRRTTERTFLEAVGEAYKSMFAPDTSLKIERGAFGMLCDVLGGLQRGGVYVIAARPGDGKTDIALQLAVTLAKDYRVDYRSLEMSTEQLTHRILSRACIINSTKFRDHRISENEQKRIGMVVDAMKGLHLVMDDTASISADDVEAKLAASKPDVMFIDYLGLMKGDTSGKKPLWQVTGETMHALKASAKRHNAVIVALVQMNRSVDKQKEPTLSDLRGSGDIEADADAVLFMRPEKGNDFLSGDDYWPVQMILAKSRHGGVGRVEYHWQPQYHRYLPLVKGEKA